MQFLIKSNGKNTSINVVMTFSRVKNAVFLLPDQNAELEFSFKKNLKSLVFNYQAPLISGNGCEMIEEQRFYLNLENLRTI